ncbi:general substrate transporter [Jimgerdemannia flammicorona]|uniref:General substrate transporter n=1 Tax=Jimgerdemannia flammicorona TaxID=994334 RepID=A0A433QG20_9FUNG|nr:general substrate transporter [Jimgerdemannia flammicorona]
MSHFQNTFVLSAVTKGLVVSVLELGCWAGALINGYFADKISRKYSIVVASIVFCIGAALQGGAQNVGYLFAGRVVGGLGIGMLSMVVPLYQSEISPPEIRGSLVALQQLAITVGILISFWIDYGTQYIDSDVSWRLPLLLQIIAGVFLGIGILFFPFSPRWLMGQNREQDALHVLHRLRRLPEDHPLVQEEWREIKAVVEFDREVLREKYPQHTNETRKSKIILGMNQYKDLFSKGIFKRLVLGCLLQLFQQFTGINAIIYYAPTIFQSIGLTGTAVSLLATGIVGIVNVIFTIPAVLFLDQFGRRYTLLVGAAMLAISQIVIAILVGLYSSDWPAHTAQGWVAVAFVYFYIANFAYSWGPIGWVYPSEIYPLRIRAKAMSVTTSMNWITNFIIGFITPPMLEAWGFGTYVFFGTFCALSFFWVLFFVPETKGRTLEEMDEVFGDRSAVQDAELMQRVHSNVAHAGIPGKETTDKTEVEP